MSTHRADERHFLDERGSSIPLAPNGLNPALILEKPVRERITDSYFYKDQCFGLNEATLISRVVSHVHFIGGTYGDSQRPSPFLCLAFKLLQLAPSDEILEEYLQFGGEKFKYLRALAVFYIRLTRRAKEVYEILEGFGGDYRKLKRRGRQGTELTYMDVFVDDLLTKERVCGATLWKMPKREVLEDLEVLEPRVSPLGEVEDFLDSDVEEVEDGRRGDESDVEEVGPAGFEGDSEVEEVSANGRGSRSQSPQGDHAEGSSEQEAMDVDVSKDDYTNR